MAIAFIFEVPGLTQEQYETVTREANPSGPPAAAIRPSAPPIRAPARQRFTDALLLQSPQAPGSTPAPCAIPSEHRRLVAATAADRGVQPTVCGAVAHGTFKQAQRVQLPSRQQEGQQDETDQTGHSLPQHGLGD